MNIEKVMKRILLWNQVDGGVLSSLRVLLKKIVLRTDLSNRIRYDPVLEHITRHKLSSGKILEEGCGSVGITRYFKHNIVGADLNFDGPKLPYLKPVSCSATSLPFSNNEFDLVFSVDMLEHIPRDLRHPVISEMIRVSRKWIIIGVPCGESAVMWEQRAWYFWQNKMKNCKSADKKARIMRRGHFLGEHKEHGLPTKSELLKIIQDSTGSKINVETIPNQSIIIWYLFAISSLRFSYPLWILSILIGTILSPILRRIMWAGNYREFFVIKKEQEV